MKTKKTLLLMVMLLMGAVGAQAEKTAKAVLSSDGTKLTFYFDENTYSPLKEYPLNTGSVEPGWLENSETITEVVFDPSFVDARPTSCFGWFKGMKNLAKVVMNNPVIDYPWQDNYVVLNTSEVTTMREMFRGCSKLTGLSDLFLLDSSKVLDMASMFNGCSMLASLNLAKHVYMGGRRTVLSKFNTTKVTTMRNMFSGCTKLTTLNLDNFNTSSVKDMGFMFNQCTNLTTITGIDKFDTSNVTTMQQMFAWCAKLAELKLPFNTSKLENMAFMFGLCQSLVSVDISSFDIPEGGDYGLFLEDYGLSELTVSAQSAKLDPTAFSDVGSKISPCRLVCVGGFTPESEEEGEGWMKWKSGYFVISRKGDANGDGNVSIPDVMLAVEYMLKGTASNFHIDNADMNGDRNITVSDVMAIVAAIMGNN